MEVEQWVLVLENVEFRVSGIPLNEAAFEWAAEALAVIRRLDASIQKAVAECLGEFEGDKTAAETFCVDLDGYPDSRTIALTFVGDDSWGDFGVVVIITDGQIIDSYGSD